MAAYGATWVTTLDARTAAFVAALSITNKTAMKKAWNMAWKNSEKAMMTAQKAKRASVQNAWNMYRTNLKACNTAVAKILMQER